jgi:branched-chain amino acid transport system permease protein
MTDGAAERAKPEPGSAARLRQSSRRWAPIIVALAGAALIPTFVNDPFDIHVLNRALIFAVLALGLQLITGIAGQFSVGHVAFFGVGAYTTGWLTTEAGLPIAIGAIGGVALAAAFGLLMAPITRLRGNYMAMATLAFLLLVNLFLRNQTALTGGTGGMGGIPTPEIFGIEIIDDTPYYYTALIALVLIFAMLYRLSGNSRFGRSMAMIRLDEEAAAAVGVNPTAVKMKAFVLSAAVGGFAGVLFAHQVGYIHPNDITLPVAILLLTMIVVGGLGSLSGAVLGAVLLTLGSEYLRFLDDWRLILYGALIMVIMIYLPTGLVGGLKQLWALGLSTVRRMRVGSGGAGPADQAEPERVGAGN